MTAPASLPPGYALPEWADSVLGTLLMGAGEGMVITGTLSQDALSAAVDALRVLAAVGWKVISANPNKTPPITMLLALVKSTPPEQQALWAAGLTEAEAAIIAKALPMIHAAVKQRLGFLAGSVDGMVDHGLQSGADAAVKALEPPPEGTGT